MNILSTFKKIAPRNSPDFNDEIVVRYWYSKLKELTGEHLINKIDGFILSKGYFPGINDIISYIPDDDFASEEAMKIIGAISKFGYVNTERAREYLGEKSWEVIKDIGGWQAFCESVTNDNIPVYRAQLRDAIKSKIKRTIYTPEEFQLSSPLKKALNLIERKN